jgi:hypothetical protein
MSDIDRPTEPTKTVVLHAGTLEGFTAAVSRSDGVELSQFEPFTTLVVRTMNSVYRITTLEPPRHDVFVEGGSFFPERVRTVLNGSTFGGSCLRQGWIGVGMHLEFQMATHAIVTSRIQSIMVARASSPRPV